LLLFVILSRHTAYRRIGDIELLINEVDAWEKERNEQWVKIEWRFTTEDARIKLKKLYPSISK
jgi:hypothetical protein